MACILFWNVFGWMGVQLAAKHLHNDHDHEQSYCTKEFCSCLVEKGQKICTCHHQNEQAGIAHNSGESHMGKNAFCVYEKPHTGPITTSISLAIHDFHAYFRNIPEPNPEVDVRFLTSFYQIPDTEGSLPALLRPPISWFM